MKSKALGVILEIFFTIVYFRCFFAAADFALIGAPIALANILAIPCLFIALVASVGLADFTVKKIKEYL